MREDDTLSVRQRQVLLCAGVGMTARQTGLHLGISEETVKQHRQRAKYTMRVLSTREALSKAWRNGDITEFDFQLLELSLGLLRTP